jgi:hypothetical protein
VTHLACRLRSALRRRLKRTQALRAVVARHRQWLAVARGSASEPE